MKTEIKVYLINGEVLSETLDVPRIGIESEFIETVKRQGVVCLRYTDGVRFITLSNILYVDIKEIS